MVLFTKMHGLGNDFVMLDNRDGRLPPLGWRALADRHTGIGCDQVVVMEKSDQADVRMRIFNADGGEVESCGNASRCVAWLFGGQKPEAGNRKIRIETRGGIVEAQVLGDGQVKVDMGGPRLGWQDIPLAKECDTLHLPVEQGVLHDPAAVSMGNPHMVFFVEDADAVPLETLGPMLERHPLFPQRVNIGIAQLTGKESIRLRVWERGAGLTLACGTGACAALVAAYRRGLVGRTAAVVLPGGELLIEWREDNHVYMTGPVQAVFKGEFDPAPWEIR